MATQGPSLPTSGTSTGTGTAWSNPTRITADDGSSASSTAIATQDLLGNTYGFSIPAGATINGIEFSAKGQDPDGAVTLTWYVYKGGSRAPTSFTGSFNSVSPNTITKGSSTELWGTTWSSSDINASNFGTAHAVSLNVSNNQTNVDFHKVTVYYTAAGAATSAAFFTNFL